ncbi:MAG: hypothetical protein Alpg2KO_01460 [Alphaproteobacteria bacterium]
MSRPRLIILDHNTPSDALENYARRVANGLRTAKPPVIIAPSRPADVVNGKPTGRLNGPLAKDWAKVEEQIEDALASGQDVVLAGPVTRGDGEAPGQDWADALAKRAGADLAGHRLVFAPDGQPPMEDDRPKHDWPPQHWNPISDGNGWPRDAARNIERRHPGQNGPNGGHIHVIDCPDPEKRHALTAALSAQEGAMKLDIVSMLAAIRQSDKWKSVPETDYLKNMVAAQMWHELEEKAGAALRAGKPVVLGLPHLPEEQMQADLDLMIDQLERISGDRMHRTRIVQAGQAHDETGGFASYQWPETADQDEAAKAIAQQLGQGATPGLDDLLDLPPLDRRHRITLPRP